MANTIYGPFSTIAITNGVTPVNATWGANAQTQASIALHGFNPDLVAGGFVLWGIACAKDSVTANKLDIYAGSAYIVLTDGTVGLISVAATSQTTSALSSTYHLYLQPDGTFYWSTSNTPQTNSLAIATVTTDGSGNISGVTDGRVTGAALLPAAIGSLQVPLPLMVEQTQNGSFAAAVIGGPTFGVAGAIKASYDTAMTFNGSSQNILVPISGLPQGNAVWSLECWFKIAANPAAPADLMAFGTSGTIRAQPGLQITTGGGLLVTTYSGDTAATAAASLNTWHHAVGTWDGTTLRSYLDGAAGPTATPGALVIGTHGAAIGSSEISSSWFPGSLDECAFYGTTLSPTQITNHFNAGNSTTSDSYASTVLGDAPLRYYRLGEASGSAYVADTISPTATTVIDDGGTFKSIAGQTTMGRMGVPAVVTETAAPGVKITATTLTQVLSSINIPTDSKYRVGMTFFNSNPTPQKVIAEVSWTDASSNVAIVNYFTSGLTGFFLNGSQAAAEGNNQVTACNSLNIYAKSGTSIGLWFRDPAGTPADIASAFIERIS